jgi:hypothetical protein
MTRTVSYAMRQDVATDGRAEELMTAGKIGGVRLRPTPAIQALWTSTFNLRWSDHLVVDRHTTLAPAENVTRRARFRPTA